MGVRATSKDGAGIFIKAETVFLDTGGFDHNDETRAKYLPWKICVTNAALGCTGNGHRMGQAAGADLAFMNFIWDAPAIITTGADRDELLAQNKVAAEVTGSDWGMYRSLPGTIVVNSRGRRFGNECAAYGPYIHAFDAFDTDVMDHVNTRAFLAFDKTCWDAYNFPGHKVFDNPDRAFFNTEGDPNEIPEYYTTAEALGGACREDGHRPRGPRRRGRKVQRLCRDQRQPGLPPRRPPL